jgi:leader peptidase (prepilin peptidase) / N-methyltransferase
MADQPQSHLGASPAADTGTTSAAIWLLLAGYVALALPVLWSGPRTWAVILPSLLLGAALVALSSIDLATLRLPDALTLPLIGAGLVCAAAFKWDNGWSGLGFRMAAAAAGYGLLYGVAWTYHRVRGRHGLGLGDAKLLAASGAWLGFDGLAPTLLVASLAALAAALVSHLSGRPVTADTRVPFGPFLAGGTWLIWLYGPLV